MKAKFIKMAMIAAAFAAVIIIGRYILSSGQTLILCGENGLEYLKLPVKNHEEFSVEFVHSVNKSPVIDYYRVVDGDIYVVATKYYGFGAGVQTELTGNEKLEYTKDGAMLVTGINRKINHLTYVVAMVSDHILTYRGQKISLEKTCKKGAVVHFVIH